MKTKFKHRRTVGNTLLKWLLTLIFTATFVQSQAGGTAVYTITSGATSLTVRSYGTNNYGIGFAMGATYYEQTKPCAIEVVTTAGVATWITGNYTSATDMGGGVYKCIGTKTSANGSVFTFTDTYSLASFGLFQVSRNVKVTSANALDKGFSSKLTLAQITTSAMSDYDFFVPGVWYKDNADVGDASLATDMTDTYFWFREDRLSLPLFMIRKKSDGVTFSICHKSPDASSFTGEDGLNRIVDSRMKFASVGMENNTNPSIGIIFPGSEGERTGVYGMSATKRWALRSNPVTLNYTQDYTLALRMTSETNFDTALKNTWIAYFSMFNPPLYSPNLTTVYNDQLALLNTYWKTINGSYGFPFRVNINGTAADADYNWDMGFVGMEIPNAAILLREGINAGNATMRSKAEQTLDWWANNSITSTGCPKTWYDPTPATWRSYDTYTRVVGDGMSGLLWAWNFEKKNNVDKVNWLNACYRVANWLVSKQNTDGSFPRAWNYTTNAVVYSEKTNTSHIIPFLVDMYKATGNIAFKNAAISAGNYIYTQVYQNFKYIGGTPDNPNVPDKEAASMALRAFLALYDVSGGVAQWLDAAKQATFYYETWVYSWNIPIPADDANASYPKNRSTTGMSLITTGGNGADSYASIDAFSFYRMYLYTADAHLLNMSKLLLQNTKQAVNWDHSNPIAGYGAYGLVQEATDFMINRGHGVGYYLPWQTYNMIEPFVLFWDAFGAGTYDIATIDNLANKTTLNNTYSTTRNFVSSNSESIVDGSIYIIVNRNSGKVLDVSGESLLNGANIQQWDYLTKTSQQWKAVKVGTNFELIAQNSIKCADVEASSLNNSANISQYTITNANNQLWTIGGVGGGYWSIVNVNSGKAMDVEGSSTINGGNVSQYTYNGTPNQQWLFVKVTTTLKSATDLFTSGNKENPKLIMYPSPASNQLIIENFDPYSKIEIFNSFGQKMYQDQLKGTSKEINVTLFDKGMYIVKFTDDQGSSLTQKFLKK